MNKVVLYGISDNMSALFQNGKYAAINTADSTTKDYYDAKLLSEPYTLKNDKTVENQVIKAGEIIVKLEYIIIMKKNTNFYQQQLETKDSFVISTRTSFYPYLSS